MHTAIFLPRLATGALTIRDAPVRNRLPLESGPRPRSGKLCVLCATLTVHECRAWGLMTKECEFHIKHFDPLRTDLVAHRVSENEHE